MIAIAVIWQQVGPGRRTQKGSDSYHQLMFASPHHDLVQIFETSSFKPGAVMSTVISILITFLVVILVLYLINLLPVDGRAKQIIRVIVIIIGVLSLLRTLTAVPF